jgi:histone H3/H4
MALIETIIAKIISNAVSERISKKAVVTYVEVASQKFIRNLRVASVQVEIKAGWRVTATPAA